ncbi:MAG: hypothetical protein WBL28_04295 [Methylotenera sp.]
MSEEQTKVEANNTMPHRQLATEEVQFIQRQAGDFASQFNMNTEQAEKQLTRGALYSIDADWQTAYNTYAPDEVAAYKIAASYLQAQSKAEGLTFVNQEKEVQAAFTVTSAQNDDKYGLKTALMNPQTRDLYERNARLSGGEMSGDEKGVLVDMLIRPAADVYYLREAVIEKLSNAKRLTEPGDMNLANSPHPLDDLKALTKNLQEDPIGTVGKMKDGVLDGVQEYALTKYMSEMQGDIAKAAKADSKVLVDMGAGAISGMAGVKAAGIVIDAAKASELGVRVLDKANDAAQWGKTQVKAAATWQGGSADLVAAGIGPVGRYLDMGNSPENVPRAGAMHAHAVDPNERFDPDNEKYGNDPKKEKVSERRPATEEELRNVRQGNGRNDLIPGNNDYGFIEKMGHHNIGDDPYNGVKVVRFLNGDVRLFRHADKEIKEINLDEALKVFSNNSQAREHLILDVKDKGGAKQVEQLEQKLTEKIQADTKLATEIIVAMGRVDGHAKQALELLDKGADQFEEAAQQAARARNHLPLDKKWSSDSVNLRPEAAEQAEMYKEYTEALVNFKKEYVRKDAVENGGDASDKNPIIKDLTWNGTMSEHFDMGEVKVELLTYQQKNKGIQQADKPKETVALESNQPSLTKLNESELAEQAIKKANQDRLNSLIDAERQGKALGPQDHMELEVGKQYGAAAAAEAREMMQNNKLGDVLKQYPYKIKNSAIESSGDNQLAITQVDPNHYVNFLNHEKSRETVLARIDEIKAQQTNQQQLSDDPQFS